MSWKSYLLRLAVWGLPLPLLVLNGWALLLLLDYFRSIFTVVVAAILLAFVLDYPVLWIQHWQRQRSRAVILVLLLLVVVLSVLGVTLIPLLIQQGNELAKRLPEWIASGSQQLNSFQTWAASRQLPIDVSHWTIELENQVAGQLQMATGRVASTLSSAIDGVINIMLTLLLTFYLLLHGQTLWDNVFQVLPVHLSRRLRQSLKQNFHNYFVGQVTVALCMAVAMAIAFVIIRVPFGLVFGLSIGMMALFPFGAALGIVIVSFLTGLNTIWLGVRVLLVATAIDQIIENGLAPQLLGGFTGLSPIWILISLLVGAKVAGLLGLIVAVPIAGSIRDTLVALIPPSNLSMTTMTDPRTLNPLDH
ncbi:AI-2E family transporter [Synechococcus sp. Nb3U1]|uniref:AI-2E family transporter n=1 Tax=Synechococcus sp. Nb3U1 TaxID=1914529 RepID=UPI001F1DDB63|nr:AI-2E family transporter [Synechococcus sp. Nb3U1]MCF2972663.1 AI-2E family transporter [Synechococcus sp. Nb3U1]